MDDFIVNQLICCAFTIPHEEISPVMLDAVKRTIHQHEMKKCSAETKNYRISKRSRQKSTTLSYIPFNLFSFSV